MPRLLIPLFLLLIVLPAAAQPAAPDPQALAEVERLGQLLYAYERAVTEAEAALLSLARVDEQRAVAALGRYVAVPTNAGWTAAFGYFDEDLDDFVVTIEVVLDDAFTVTTVDFLDHPEPRSTGYGDAARGILAAIEQFEFREDFYKFAVLPADNGELFVYIMPAQTEPGHYPLGRDARFRFDTANRAITETVILHTTPQTLVSEVEGELVSGTLSLASNSEVPAETAVLLAMQRQPAIPHYVLAGDWVFAIDPSGSIHPVPAAEFGMED